MEFGASGMTHLSKTGSRGRPGRSTSVEQVDDVDDSKFKSKNLKAERKRRKKLSDRLLELRALVPKITNMTKATIILDAITHIEELQETVKALSDQLMEMDASMDEAAAMTRTDDTKASEAMKQYGIKEDVQVTNIDGNKLWIKIIVQKKRGRFAKLIEAITYLGFELTDTSVTTSAGALLISSCLEGTCGDTLTAQQTKELLLEIIKGI